MISINLMRASSFFCVHAIHLPKHICNEPDFISHNHLLVKSYALSHNISLRLIAWLQTVFQKS